MIRATYIGVLNNFLIPNATSNIRSFEEKVVDFVECSNLTGRTLRNPEEVTVDITRHGIKISTAATHSVIIRIPLIKLILITTFVEKPGRLGAIIVEHNTTSRLNLHLILLSHDSLGVALCNLIKDAFTEAEEVSTLMETIEPPSPSVTQPVT